MPSPGPALYLSAFVLCGLSLPCAAQEAGDRDPVALQKVLDCRTIKDSQARLACFDTSVEQLDTARAAGDITIVDREEIKRTRRGLFGFNLPGLGILSHHGDGDPRKAVQDDALKEIVGKARAVARNVNGGWVITLEDGARWEQIDSTVLGRFPKPGSVVIVRRAALGSYKMILDGGPAVRARRIG